jgi:hypothetical protein
MRRRAVLMMPERERPHPRRLLCIGLEDAADTTPWSARRSRHRSTRQTAAKPIARLTISGSAILFNGEQAARHPSDYAYHEASDKPLQRDWPQEEAPQDGAMVASFEQNMSQANRRNMSSGSHTNHSNGGPRRRPRRAFLFPASECESSNSLKYTRHRICWELRSS